MNEGCCAATAVRVVVRTSLRRGTTLLPRAAWRAACMKCMQWIVATLDDMKQQNPDAEAQLMGIMHSETGGTGVGVTQDSERHQSASMGVAASAANPPQMAQQEQPKESNGALHGHGVLFVSCEGRSPRRYVSDAGCPDRTRAV